MNKSPILYFDGYCNLCHASVQFILRRERNSAILFASLQSGYAKKHLPEGLVSSTDPESLVFVENGKIYEASSAAVRIANYLSFPWRALIIFQLIPTFIRDKLYFFIARNRYRWFGKKDQCMLPETSMKNRFLDDEV